MQIYKILQKLRELSDQKKKAIIIAVVCVVAFVGGFWWVRSSLQRLDKLGQVASNLKLPEINAPESTPVAIVNETKDWKTYKNEKHGFEFEYPSDFEILQITEEVPNNPVQVALGPIEEDNFNSNWVIILKEKDICKNNIETGGKVLEDVSIGGVIGKKIQYFNKDENGQNYVYTKVCVEKDGLSYNFSCSIAQLGNYDYSNFDKMLSTFKFTK